MSNRIAVPSLTPDAVVTTLTAPDCVGPVTVIEDLVTAIDRMGSVDAWADAAESRLTTARRDATSMALGT
jgi:hypothetical protein